MASLAKVGVKLWLALEESANRGIVTPLVSET